MPDDGETRSAGPDLGMVRAWTEYAKDRFAAAEARIAEYRSWARQLIAAIGVVIGLEVTIVARLALDAKLPLASALRVCSLTLLLVPLAVQFFALRRLLHVGYRGEHLLGPEAPTKLADYLAEKDEAEAQRVIGAYYAKAFDHFHALAERLGKEVAAATARFQWTLPPVLLGVALLAIGALWAPSGSGSHDSGMAKNTRTPSATVTPKPPAATPSNTPVPEPKGTQNPLLITPTAGQVETHGAKPGKQTNR
jgi:hypothetical protein